MSALGDVVSGAVANMIVFGAFIYGAIRPLPGEYGKIWSVVAIPAAFNISVAILKRGLTFEQRSIALLVTALLAGLYVALVMGRKLPRRRAGTGE